MNPNSKRKSELLALPKSALVEMILEFEQKLVPDQLPPKNFPDKYNSEWTWAQKITYALLKLNKAATSGELIQLINQYDVALGKYENIQKSFSNHLIKTVAYGHVTKHRAPGIRGYYYGLPEWCDKKGELFLAFKPKLLR